MKVYLMPRVNKVNVIGYAINKCAMCGVNDFNLHPLKKSRTSPKVCTACMKASR